MISKSKIIILVSAFCAIVGILLVFLYSQTDPSTRFRHKRTELYKKEYNAVLDSCKKWGGNYSGNISSKRLVNQDTNFIYLATLVEKYKIFDKKYFPSPNFGDLYNDSLMTLYHAENDAKYDFIKTKYGQGFKERVRLQSAVLNLHYKIHYYDSILTPLTRKSIIKRIVRNGITVIIFDKSFLDTLPFDVHIETDSENDMNRVVVMDLKDKIKIRTERGIKKSGTSVDVPLLYACFYFSSTKSDFPYCKYAFKKLLLTDK